MVHADDAMKPLKCISVSFQWVWRNLKLNNWSMVRVQSSIFTDFESIKIWLNFIQCSRWFVGFLLKRKRVEEQNLLPRPLIWSVILFYLADRDLITTLVLERYLPWFVVGFLSFCRVYNWNNTITSQVTFFSFCSIPCFLPNKLLSFYPWYCLHKDYRLSFT